MHHFFCVSICTRSEHTWAGWLCWGRFQVMIDKEEEEEEEEEE
jgi:hypothetical protein